MRNTLHRGMNDILLHIKGGLLRLSWLSLALNSGVNFFLDLEDLVSLLLKLFFLTTIFGLLLLFKLAIIPLFLLGLFFFFAQDLVAQFFLLALCLFHLAPELFLLILRHHVQCKLAIQAYDLLFARCRGCEFVVLSTFLWGLISVGGSLRPCH